MPRLSQISGQQYDRMLEFGPVAHWPQKGILIDDKYLGFNVKSPKEKPITLGNMVIRVLGEPEELEISYVPGQAIQGLCLGQTTFDTDPFHILTLVDRDRGSINLFDTTGALVEHDLTPMQADSLFVAMSIAVLDRIARDDEAARK